MPTRLHHLIGGKPHPSPDGNLPIHNPATGQVTAHAPVGDAAVVEVAVDAAQAAGEAWAETSLAGRARVLHRFRELLAARAGDLAEAITAEHGKILTDAAGEVSRAIETVEFACGIPAQLTTAYADQAATHIDVHEVRQPLGVVTGISPFNFPVMVPMWMAAPAIACGNAFILKPSERDPGPSMLLAEMWSEAGLPAGVFNVVHGDATTVDSLLQNPGIAAVSFIGSTPIALKVYTAAAATGKRVQALGGAKNHMVVLPDADLDDAASAAVSAAFGSAGQRCMAISVVVAVGSIGDELASRIVQIASTLRPGPGDAADSDYGPLITREAADRVANYVEAAERVGARVVLDGRDIAVPDGGFFLGPTVVDGVHPGMSVYDDEVFGPLLCLVRVPDLPTALRLINDNRYGNGAAIFTSSGPAARAFSRRVTAGMVGINVPIPVPVSQFSFGGWKDSLFGDLHMQGPQSIAFWTRAKVVTTRWPEAEEDPGGQRIKTPSLSMPVTA